MHHADQWESTAALLAHTPVPVGRASTWALARTLVESARRDDAHLVASVLVVDASGRVLLARHRRYGQWGQLGGHVDAEDASLSAAAARELLEETSLAARIQPVPVDVHLSSYPCRTATVPTLHLDVCFAAFVGEPAPRLIAGDELWELGWFPPHQLPTPVVAGLADTIPLAMATLRPSPPD